jgi:hypothetical protein
MATLDAAAIAEIRLLSGDDCTPYVVSDAQIQLFNDAVSDSQCATITLVVRARWANATGKTGVNTQTGATILNPALPGIEALYKSWVQSCTDALPTMGQGLINLGIDEVLPDTE